MVAKMIAKNSKHVRLNIFKDGGKYSSLAGTASR